MRIHPMAGGLLVLTLLCTGCGTRAVDPARAQPVGSRRLLPDYALYAHPAPSGAKLIVTRDAGGLDTVETFELQVDGRPVANLRPGRRLDLFVYSGERLLGVEPNPGFIGGPDAARAFVFQPGQTYHLRVGVFGRSLDVRLATAGR